MQQVFNNLFATDDSAFIYIACHSGVISVRPSLALILSSLLHCRVDSHAEYTPFDPVQSSFRALNHPVFSVQTGGMVPMLIKAEGGPNVSRAVITGGNSKCVLSSSASFRHFPSLSLFSVERN
jgi:hypothetical protein